MIKVFGHGAPDTDATCSPIAFAWYLNKKGEEASAYVSGELNKETQFVLDKFGINAPEQLPVLSEGDKVVILDTNNPEELPSNVNEAEILEIVDHHKLFGGLMTSSPVRVTMKPIACTATLVWQRIQSDNIEVEPNIAGIMLAAILSDTLKFTSPTTTEEDKKAAKDLADISGVDVDDLATSMFNAKSDLSGMSVRDVLTVDSKVFDFNGKKVRISVIETTNPDNAKSMREEVSAEMAQTKKQENLDYMFFFIINILTTSAELLSGSEEENKLSEKAFGETFSGSYMSLPGVVSRKKQIAPKLESVIS